jgi:hypothetical protein
MDSGQAFTQRPQPLQRSESISGFPLANTTPPTPVKFEKIVVFA